MASKRAKAAARICIAYGNATGNKLPATADMAITRQYVADAMQWMSGTQRRSMANTSVRSNVIDLTPPSVRRAQESGGSTFRGQVQNIIATQVEGLPVGTAFTVGTIPDGSAPLIEFVVLANDRVLTLTSPNGTTVTMRPRVAAAAISYLAANWLLWHHHYAGDDVAGLIANNQWEALGRYIFRSGRFKQTDIAAIALYTD
jgi:hypothetical protein